jgi:hypothetical protein
MQIEISNPCQTLVDRLLPELGQEDDLAFWCVAVKQIVGDALPMLVDYRRKESVLLEIGPCSHWIRPHWQGKGTRFPSGYDKTVNGFSYRAPPAFDWSLRWQYLPEKRQWEPVERQPTRRPLVYRIAIPARTTRHDQATVHSIWMPGSPLEPQEKLTIVYGFERSERQWEFVTTWDWKHAS